MPDNALSLRRRRRTAVRAAGARSLEAWLARLGHLRDLQGLRVHRPLAALPMDSLLARNRDALARAIQGRRSCLRVYNATLPPSTWRLVVQNAYDTSAALRARIASAQLDYIIATRLPLVRWQPTHHQELTGELRDEPLHVPMMICFACRT